MCIDCRLNLWRGSEGVGSGQRVRDRLKSLAGEEYGGQSELARGIGVPRQRLFDLITGKSTPYVKAWLKISDEEEEGSRRRNE